MALLAQSGHAAQVDWNVPEGYRLVVSTFVFIAFFATAFGAFVRGPLVKHFVALGSALLVVGMVAASVLPLPISLPCTEVI